MIGCCVQVLTLEEKPFVEAEIKTKNECDFYIDPESKEEYQQVYCPATNSSTGRPAHLAVS